MMALAQQRVTAPHSVRRPRIRATTRGGARATARDGTALIAAPANQRYHTWWRSRNSA
jgi:hypothetical protein